MSAARRGLAAKHSSSGKSVSSQRSLSPARSWTRYRRQAVPGGRGEGEVHGDLAQVHAATGPEPGCGHRVGRLRLVRDQGPVSERAQQLATETNRWPNARSWPS